MFYFILEFIFLCCLGVVVYLFVSKLPLIDGFEGSIGLVKEKKNYFGSEFIQKIDKFFLSFFEKTLRKFKLSLMKMDNFVSSRLDTIKTNKDDNSTNGQNLINEIQEDKKEEGEKLL